MSQNHHSTHTGRILRKLSGAACYCTLLSVLCGCGVPSFLITPVRNRAELEEQVVQPGRGWAPEKVAIIEVEGMLLNAPSGGFLQPTENPLSLFIQQLEQAETDSKVKAIVLRVNSPGGTVTASDTMYQALLRFKQRTGKPVIASTQDIAASGAYYVSCAADQIVACPTSVIGSVGVIFQTFDASGTMAKIGLRSEPIKSGTFKDIASPLHPLTDPERKIMQAMVDEMHQRFLAVVKAGRPIKDEASMAIVADGRVFSGQNAVAMGLADRLGTLEDAIELAREKAKAPDARVVLYKRPHGYGGSIYARTPTPAPQSGVIVLPLPPSRAWLPTGFYYLWEP